MEPPVNRPADLGTVQKGPQSAKRVHISGGFWTFRIGEISAINSRSTYALDGNDPRGAIVVFVWTTVANRHIARKGEEPVIEAADWFGRGEGA